MNYLYRYECKPNYPVIPCAFVIFFSAIPPINRVEGTIHGRALAEKLGLVNAPQREKIIYMGMFEPALKGRLASDQVMFFMTGEY